MFLDRHAFTFVPGLERNWQAIRDEALAMQNSAMTLWPERFLYVGNWEVLGLYAFGRKLAQNCSLCPETTRWVETIPGLTTAGFSLLGPNTHIRPHRGYTGAVLRCHLGLVVPDSGCELRVGAETRRWVEGECIVFDDTVEHEAWNSSTKARLVLLLDFLRSLHVAG